MSIIRREPVRCSVCGHKQTVTYVQSLFGMGSSDLDSRPPRMISRYMSIMVHKCRRCGYAANRLANGDAALRPVLRSVPYLLCEGKPLFRPLAVRFYQSGLLDVHQNDYAAAYFAFLHAAWACDDVKNRPGATACRKKAIQLFDRLPKDGASRERLVAIQTDLLRRTGQFRRAMQLMSAEPASSEWMVSLADYEKTLIAGKDRKRHNAKELTPRRSTAAGAAQTTETGKDEQP